MSQWYEKKGSSGELAGSTTSLGWVPVIVHAGLASQTAWSIYYVTRYAWLQKIDDWVTLFAHIQFSVTWTSGGGTSAWSPITISGIPYKAWTGVSGSPVIAAATAYGEVYEFPRTEIYDVSDADRMHHPDAGSFGGTDTRWPANDSTLKCFMLENEDILRFYPTTIAESGPTYPAGRMVAQAFNVNGTGPALISSNRVTVNFEKETSGTPTVAASLDKIYTVAFKIQYRAL